MAKNTIKLKKYLDVIIERAAAGTITPGMLVELTSTDLVQAFSGSGTQPVPIMFALEDELQGRGIDDNYVITDPVQVWVAQSGEVVYAILADGETVSIGEKVQAKNDGTLVAFIAGVPVGVALEAVDTAGSPAGVTSRIRIMIR